MSEIIEVQNNITLYDGVRISPYAYQKIMYFMDRGKTEVTGFGVTGEDDLSIIDFHLVKQECSVAEVNMDADGMSKYLDKMMDKDIPPSKCFRYWIHTHPGASPNPSGQDETQFEEFMSNYPWIVMLIFAKTQSTYCRLGVNQGPGAKVNLNVTVDWSIPCQEVDFLELEKEYLENVSIKTYAPISTPLNWKQGSWRQHSDIPQFHENYEGIDWSERGAMQQVGKKWAPRYLDDGYDLFTSQDDDLDLFEIDTEDMEKILNKDIHSMTDEELEAYEEYCNGEMGID